MVKKKAKRPERHEGGLTVEVRVKGLDPESPPRHIAGHDMDVTIYPDGRMEIRFSRQKANQFREEAARTGVSLKYLLIRVFEEVKRKFEIVHYPGPGNKRSPAAPQPLRRG